MIAALPLVAAMAAAGGACAAPAARFGEADVQAIAQDLSRRPYVPPSVELPRALSEIDYDEYRDIRFRPAKALWKAEGLPFQLQFFHRGFLAKDKVEIFEVRDGRAVPVLYSPDLFDFKRRELAEQHPDLGFAGFRIHAPINNPDYYDEVGVFLGASYFRAVAKDILYGLSARGLAIGVAEQEEFPIFRTFWIERPAKGAKSLTVHALLDSPSCAGAFSFVITPGATTVFDTRARLFPRRDIANAGIAPLTSMFLFGEGGQDAFADFRGEVHDSDGLSIVNGAGERIWRPLINPKTLQVSAFKDRKPAGFGLIQRERRLDAYGDLEARYEKRPSLWVEPSNDWGDGSVRLVEIPTLSETNDNIVSYWAPAAPLKAGVPLDVAYRLHWGPEPQVDGLARVVRTEAKDGVSPPYQRFSLDFDVPAGVAPETLAANVTAATGQVSDVEVAPIPGTGRARLQFGLNPGPPPSELRASLTRSGTPCSEVWLYRWTA